jgi:hypothetical protein
LKENPEFLSAVGRVSVEFSLLEDLLSDFIILLLDNKNSYALQMIVCELSFKQRISALMSLYRYRSQNETDVENLRELLVTCMNELDIERNDYIHGQMHAIKGIEFALFKKTTAKFKPGLRVESKLVPIAEIDSLAVRIRETKEAIGAIFGQYFKSLPESDRHPLEAP